MAGPLANKPVPRNYEELVGTTPTVLQELVLGSLFVAYLEVARHTMGCPAMRITRGHELDLPEKTDPGEVMIQSALPSTASSSAAARILGAR